MQVKSMVGGGVISSWVQHEREGGEKNPWNLVKLQWFALE